MATSAATFLKFWLFSSSSSSSSSAVCLPPLLAMKYNHETSASELSAPSKKCAGRMPSTLGPTALESCAGRSPNGGHCYVHTVQGTLHSHSARLPDARPPARPPAAHPTHGMCMHACITHAHAHRTFSMPISPSTQTIQHTQHTQHKDSQHTQHIQHAETHIHTYINMHSTHVQHTRDAKSTANGTRREMSAQSADTCTHAWKQKASCAECACSGVATVQTRKADWTRLLYLLYIILASVFVVRSSMLCNKSCRDSCESSAGEWL